MPSTYNLTYSQSEFNIDIEEFLFNHKQNLKNATRISIRRFRKPELAHLPKISEFDEIGWDNATTSINNHITEHAHFFLTLLRYIHYGRSSGFICSYPHHNPITHGVRYETCFKTLRLEESVISPISNTKLILEPHIFLAVLKNGANKLKKKGKPDDKQNQSPVSDLNLNDDRTSTKEYVLRFYQYYEDYLYGNCEVVPAMQRYFPTNVENVIIEEKSQSICIQTEIPQQVAESQTDPYEPSIIIHQNMSNTITLYEVLMEVLLINPLPDIIYTIIRIIIGQLGQQNRMEDIATYEKMDIIRTIVMKSATNDDIINKLKKNPAFNLYDIFPRVRKITGLHSESLFPNARTIPYNPTPLIFPVPHNKIYPKSEMKTFLKSIIYNMTVPFQGCYYQHPRINPFPTPNIPKANHANHMIFNRIEKEIPRSPWWDTTVQPEPYITDVPFTPNTTLQFYRKFQSSFLNPNPNLPPPNKVPRLAEPTRVREFERSRVREFERSRVREIEGTRVRGPCPNLIPEDSPQSPTHSTSLTEIVRQELELDEAQIRRQLEEIEKREKKEQLEKAIALIPRPQTSLNYTTSELFR